MLLTGDRDVEYLDELASLLRRVGTEHKLAVTTGGGRNAREYIRVGRALGLTEVELDELGIEVTRLHARLLAGRIGAPTPSNPPTTVAQAVQELRHASPVVLGGTEPGHTTDGVAALLAVRLRAGLVVNATAVDGLYEQDPRSHPEARHIESIGWPEFRAQVLASGGTGAGQEFVFDRLGADLLSRARIPLVIVHGRDLANLGKALAGQRCRGTRVGASEQRL